MISYFKADHRYQPQGLNQTERRAKLLLLLRLCQKEGSLNDKETAQLFDEGVRIMHEESED